MQRAKQTRPRKKAYSVQNTCSKHNSEAWWGDESFEFYDLILTTATNIILPDFWCRLLRVACDEETWSCRRERWGTRLPATCPEGWDQFRWGSAPSPAATFYRRRIWELQTNRNDSLKTSKNIRVRCAMSNKQLDNINTRQTNKQTNERRSQ